MRCIVRPKSLCYDSTALVFWPWKPKVYWGQNIVPSELEHIGFSSLIRGERKQIYLLLPFSSSSLSLKGDLEGNNTKNPSLFKGSQEEERRKQLNPVEQIIVVLLLPPRRLLPLPHCYCCVLKSTLMHKINLGREKVEHFPVAIVAKCSRMYGRWVLLGTGTYHQPILWWMALSYARRRGRKRRKKVTLRLYYSAVRCKKMSMHSLFMCPYFATPSQEM